LHHIIRGWVLNCEMTFQVRAGTGGGEAALWAAELLRMYTKYASLQSWKVNVINTSEGEGGGLKEAVIQVCPCHPVESRL